MSTSKLQEFTAQQLYQAFPHLTIKENYHPEWLQNPDGNRLELDFYLPELKLAIEIQGQQHYKYTPFFHNDYQGFLDQLKRDNIKRDTCLIEGVKLIEVDNKQDVINLIQSFKSSDTKKQKPIPNFIQSLRPPYKGLYKKLKRVQNSLLTVNVGLARCDPDDTEKIDRLLNHRNDILSKMSLLYEKIENKQWGQGPQTKGKRTR